MADFTTVGLLAGIRRRAMLPSATSTGTADADLLALANEELWLRVNAAILGVREDYLVTYTDTTVSGVTYRVPSRSTGQVIREAKLVDASGNELHLTRLRPEQVSQYAGSGAAPFGYYLRGTGYFVLVPSASTTLPTLRLFFPLRPSELTATATDYSTILTINTSTGVVTHSANNYGTTNAIDFVSATPGFDVMAADLTPSASGVGTITVAAGSLPAGLAVGDYVCRAGKAPVPTIPLEFHQILEQRVAITLSTALGDHETAQRLIGELVNMEQDAGMTVLTPRTEGSPRKILARSSPLGGTRRTF